MAEAALPSPSGTGDSDLLPQFLGVMELASLDASDMELITRTTSLSQPHDSANSASDLEVADSTASYTWSRKYAETKFCLISLVFVVVVFNQRMKFQTEFDDSS